LTVSVFYVEDQRRYNVALNGTSATYLQLEGGTQLATMSRVCVHRGERYSDARVRKNDIIGQWYAMISLASLHLLLSSNAILQL
jgi:hypothetical protein